MCDFVSPVAQRYRRWLTPGLTRSPAFFTVPSTPTVNAWGPPFKLLHRLSIAPWMGSEKRAVCAVLGDCSARGGDCADAL